MAPLDRVAELDVHPRVAQHRPRPPGGLRVLEVARGLVAEQVDVAGVGEPGGDVPLAPALRLLRRQEHLRLRADRTGHRDARVGVEQVVQVRRPAALRPDDQQVPHGALALTWKVSVALTALRVRTRYSPSIDSIAMVKPLKIESSTISVVQPGTEICPSRPSSR